VSITNQRDWLFVRRWRYKFAIKRETEKQLTDADGKPLKGVEDIRARLQPLGPSFCMKLRKVYKGIGFAGSEGEDAVQWEFKPKLEKQRTRFYL
jgi:ribosome production factor 1